MVSEKMKALGMKRSVIREIFEYSKKRKAEIGEDAVFDFSIGNPSVPAPIDVTLALHELLDTVPAEKLHAYTSAQGDFGVRSAISSYVNEKYKAKTDADLIYMTCGAAAALAISLKAIVSRPKDEVLVLAPYFPEYKVFIENAGAKMRSAALSEPDFQIDARTLSLAINKNTRAVIINSPNNPSGSVLSHDSIKTLCRVLGDCEKKFGHRIYIISDEPYRELLYTDGELPYITNYYKNSIVCYSFSKSLSLPGERIGYLLVNPEADEAHSVYAAIMGAGRSLGYVCAGSMLQFLIPKCLGKTADVSIYAKNRDVLFRALTEYGFSCVNPSGAFYMFVKSPEKDAYAFCERAKKYELLFVPGDDFGYPGYVRIAYCTQTDIILRALDSFKKLADEYRG